MDYVTFDKDVVFPANESLLAVEIQLIDDDIVENDEAFSVSMSALQEYALVYEIVQSQSSVGILNDDCELQ